MDDNTKEIIEKMKREIEDTATTIVFQPTKALVPDNWRWKWTMENPKIFNILRKIPCYRRAVDKQVAIYTRNECQKHLQSLRDSGLITSTFTVDSITSDFEKHELHGNISFMPITPAEKVEIEFPIVPPFSPEEWEARELEMVEKGAIVDGDTITFPDDYDWEGE